MKNLKYITAAFCFLPTLFLIANKAVPDSVAFSLYNFAAIAIVLQLIKNKRQLLVCWILLALLTIVLLIVIVNTKLEGMFFATLGIQAVWYSTIFSVAYIYASFYIGDSKTPTNENP